MRTLTALTIALVALAACTGDRPLASSAAPTLAVASATCDVSLTKSDARAYVASGSDPIFGLITDLGSLVRNGPNAAATSKAFDALARESKIRGTTAQRAGSTPAQGAKLALDLLGCMESNVTSALPSSSDLAGALGAGGLFAVRGGAADAASGGVFSAAVGGNDLNVWGAQPASSWATATGGARILLYGAPIASLDANLFRDPLAAPTGFDFHMAPTIAFAQPIIVGTCAIDFADAGSARIQHVGDVLPKQSLDCTQRATTASIEPVGMFASLAHGVTDLFTPTPLYAAMMLPGGVGGLASSFSPYAAVTTIPVLSYGGQPLNGYVNSPLPGSDAATGKVVVVVKTAGGTPLAGAVVTIAVANNSGTTVLASGTTATTDASGRAVFTSLTVNKAGGYTITASAAFDSIAAARPIISNLFNVQNKAAP